MTSPPDDILDLLTAYALGALEPSEIARVSALLDDQPELRATLAELRSTADKLPFGLPEAVPPEDLRQRVLDHATGRTSPTVAAQPRRPARRLYGWLAGLSGIAAVAVLAAVIGWAQLFQARNDLVETRAVLVETQRQVAESQALIASLQGSGGSASILRTRDGAAIMIAHLPPLEPGRVYQLWRIQGSNSPASAGTFFVNPQGFTTADLPSGQQPQAGEVVAVTNEPVGGSAGPTSDPLIVGTSQA
jgi:anti-sigma-K factor RskA